MKRPRRKKPRVYTLRDLMAIAEQLGGRLQISIEPAELSDTLQTPGMLAEQEMKRVGAAIAKAEGR